MHDRWSQLTEDAAANRGSEVGPAWVAERGRLLSPISRPIEPVLYAANVRLKLRLRREGSGEMMYDQHA